MSTRDSKRYYWLKLDKGFFHRHDIRIIESMENGKDYLLFYLKMLCEATSHNGELRFSENIPYTDAMLATVTDTNIDTVRAAMKLFTELGMLEVKEDLTITMTELPKMVGSETHAAQRKRMQRWDNVPQLSQVCRTEKEIEKEKEIDIEIEKDIDIDIDNSYSSLERKTIEMINRRDNG